MAEHIINSMDQHQESPKKISIVVPIGGFPNGSQKLKTWINPGTKADIEIILVLDTDDLEVAREIEELVASLPNLSLQVVQSSARNPGAARNLGMEKATSEWVCFWDSDDTGLVDQILSDVELGRQNQADLVVGRFTRITVSKDNEIIEEHTSREPTLEGIYLNPGLWRIIFRRSFIQDYRFSDLRMAEDQVFIFGLLQKSPKILFSNSVSYQYYDYPSNQLTKSRNALDDLPHALELTVKLYQNLPKRNLVIGILRQYLSTIKFCSVGKKLVATKKFLGICLTRPKFAANVPWSLARIMRQK